MSTPTIGEALDILADRAPQALAASDATQSMDRRTLQCRSRALARLLRDEGVRPDDVVAVQGGNEVALVVAMCAIWRAGATPLPLGDHVTASERDAVLAAAAPALALGGAAGSGPRTLPLEPSLAGVDDGALPALAARSWKAIPTSGSTGTPKVVIAAASSHVDPDRAAAPFLPTGARQLVAAPLTRSAPFTYAFRGLMTGHTLHLLPRAHPADILEAIARHGITWLLLAPSVIRRILQLPPETLAATDLSSLETLVHIGAPLAADLQRRLIDLVGATRVVEVYAGTESNGVVAIRGDDWLRHPGSVGRPVSGTEVRVVDSDGLPVAAGRRGRVQLRRTSGTAYRYLGREPLADAAWDSLGDDGHLDAEGWLHLVDRGADRIVRDGTTFYPAEIEEVLGSHPAVLDVAAVGEVDAEGRVRLRVAVQVAPGTADAAVLREWADARLTGARRVDELRLVLAALHDDAGKVRRRGLFPRG